eukprot:4775357-Pleurochrysis_carterae.AAC.5
MKHAHARGGHCAPSKRAHVRAVVKAPHARRLVLRAGHHMLAVGSHADRVHAIGMPLERAHLRAIVTVEGRLRTSPVSTAEREGAQHAI